jgi:uncharacterized membrane protein YgcG
VTLAAVVDGCFGSAATQATCGAAEAVAANKTCFQCFLAESSSAKWAPILFIADPPNSPAYPFNNPAGCVAAKDPVHGPACQAALDGVTQCEIAACVDSCPGSDAGTPDLIGTFDSNGNLVTPGCIENARSGTTCQSYVTAANAACAPEVNDAGTGALDTCNALATFQSVEDVQKYFGVVCGGLGSGSGEGSDAGGSGSGSGGDAGGSGSGSGGDASGHDAGDAGG